MTQVDEVYKFSSVAETNNQAGKEFTGLATNYPLGDELGEELDEIHYTYVYQITIQNTGAKNIYMHIVLGSAPGELEDRLVAEDEVDGLTRDVSLMNGETDITDAHFKFEDNYRWNNHQNEATIAAGETVVLTVTYTVTPDDVTSADFELDFLAQIRMFAIQGNVSAGE